MLKINEGQPTAYNIVFPVFGGRMNDLNQFVPTEIFGTAFYIGNNFFVTCCHTIKAAQEQGVITLGYQNEDRTLSFAQVNSTELFEENDSGIINAYIERAKANPWLAQKLSMLNDVISIGYPYGFDNDKAEVLIRSYKGHIVLVGFYHLFNSNPHYEISYQVPRGLSGGPLLFLYNNATVICGMTIGNQITEIVVNSFKEVDSINNKTTVYEKTEALHRGIAMQSISFFKTKSNLLGMTFYDYLTQNKLICS